MKTMICTTLFLSAILLVSASLNGQNIKVEKAWATADILTTSESVLYEPGEKMLYVSCINGNPTDKDGNGFISQVTLSGEIVLLKWATGLNAPKGMAVSKGMLYVTDIDRVVRIDLESGKILKEFPVEGARFLNDITTDNEGNIYISDMATYKIHRIHNDALGTWLEDENIVSPNGMNFSDGEVLIGTKKGIYGVRIEDKRIWQIVSVDGGIDGLKLYDKNNYIISDWVGRVQMVSPGDENLLLLDLSKKNMNAADLEYIPENNLLLIPTFSDNRVVAYELIN